MFNKTRLRAYAEKIEIDHKSKEKIHDYIKKVENNEFLVETQHYHQFQRMIIEDIWGYELDDIIPNFVVDEGNENAEFVLKINDQPSMVIELKGQGTDLDKRQGKNYRYRTPIEQARDYAYNTAQLEWYIVSNYEEIRLYNYHEKRKYVSFDVKELKENNFEHLKTFILCFSKEFHSGNITQLGKESQVAEIKFKKDFYKLYDATRRMLIKELEEINNFDRHKSIKYAQLILNRYLFICFGQYRGLLPYQITIETIKSVIDDRDLRDQEIWHKLNLLFSHINEGNERKNISKYNGGFFSEDLNFIKIRDEVDDLSIFSEIIQDWEFEEYPLDIESIVTPYSRSINPIYKNLILIASFDFSQQLDVNILGNIFESSLSDLEELKEGDINVRKGSGIYYTPEYITDFVCRNTIIPFLSKSGNQNTIDGLIREYSDSIEELDKKVKEIKIIDPSCGSGAFLNKASDILLEIHEAIHVILYDKDPKLTKHFDTIDERCDILIKNIYGVDLNEESVELTKLSLFLNIFKNEEKAAILPSLDDNIKCGNSIINDKGISPHSFDWENQFTFRVFDIVIGNPPHGASFSPDEKLYIDDNYELNKNYKLNKHYESCKLFFEVAEKIVAEKNVVSYVIPKSFTYNSSWEDSRDYFFNKSKIESCIDLGVAFKDVKHEQVFLKVSFEETDQDYAYLGGFLTEKTNKLNEIPIDLSKKYRIVFANFDKNDIEIGYELFNKKYPIFKGLFDIFRGFGSDYMDDSGVPSLVGKDINRYYHNFPSHKVKPTLAKLERMKQDKVISQRILAHVTNPIDKLYIKTTVADNSILNMETVTNIVPNDGISNFFIVSLLNSKFLGWYIYRFIYNKAIRNMDFDSYYVNKVVLPHNFDQTDAQNFLIEKVKENIDIFDKINEIRRSFIKYLNLEFGLEQVSQKIHDYFLYHDELEIEMKKKKVKFTPKKLEKLAKNLEDSLIRINPLLEKFNQNNELIDNEIFKIYDLNPETVEIILNESK